MGDVQRMCERCLTEKWEYKRKTLEYIRSLMLSMDQRDLILELDVLSYKELEMAVGAGVPGEAQQFARDKLREMKKKATQATEKSTSFTWVTTPEPTKQEENVDGDTGVQTPEG